MGLTLREMFALLTLASTFILYATSPPQYDDIDEEMRGYVKYAATMLGYSPDAFSSHITETESWANNSYFQNGYSQFYVITFDKGFVESHPPNIRKAIAGHEVGHSYPPCERIYMLYYYGVESYVHMENCADVVGATIFGFQNMLAALEAIKKEEPEARGINGRISMLKKQFGPKEKDLTPAP